MLKFYVTNPCKVNEVELTKYINMFKFEKNYIEPTEVINYLMTQPCDEIAVFIEKVYGYSFVRTNFDNRIFSSDMFHQLLAMLLIAHFESGREIGYKLGNGII